MNYQNQYDKIINEARLENRVKKTYYARKKENFISIYYEKHHIIPRCLGGNENQENKVLLTAKEHFVCHKLLTYIYKGNRKIACAFYYMTFNKRMNKHIKSAKDYAYARELISLIPKSEESKQKQSKSMKGHIPWNKGKKNVYNDDAIKIMSEKRKKYIEEHKNDPTYIEATNNFINANRGKTFSSEHKEKLSKSHLGIVPSEETKQKMKNNHYDCRGKNNGMFGKKHKSESLKKMSTSVKNREKVKCQHCNKEMNKVNYKRWHNENCKHKIIDI